MPNEFSYDVFLSHSAKDNAVVRPLAERLRHDGLKVWFDEWALKPGDSIPAKIEEGLEQSRVLVLCMSVNAFGSDWAQLEAGTFRFRDPLNKERRFIPLRLDDAPIKGSLGQFLYIEWLPAGRAEQYAKLLAACRPESDAQALATPILESGKLDAHLASPINQKDRVLSRNERLQANALELCAKLTEVPPLRQEKYKEDFRGFWVIWWTTLSSASKHWSDGDLCLLQLLPDLPEGYTTPIECAVKMADYPILKVLQRGARIRVRGQIDDFSLYSVRLANATIESFEPQLEENTTLDACTIDVSDAVPHQESLRPIGDAWAGLRGVLQQTYSTQIIKRILGKAGLPISRIKYTGTYKGPVLDEADTLVSLMDHQARDRFAVGCIQEILALERARAATLESRDAECEGQTVRDLKQVLARFGHDLRKFESA